MRINVELEPGDWLVTIHDDGGFRAWRASESGVGHVIGFPVIMHTFRSLNAEAEASKRAAVAEMDDD